MNFKFLIRNKILSLRFFRIALVFIGVIVVLFNDVFGKIEGFIEFLFLYFIVVCVTVFHWLFVNIKLILNLKEEKKKTELMHLQSQVNPHFFFNMLNNLYGLVDSDSEKAKELILKLSDMMRYSIYEGQKDLVTLKQEMDFINNFLELHKMRYHKKIKVNFNVDVQNKNVQLTPLLFIILVENAFKHGIEVLRDNAYVIIDLFEKNHTVKFRIKNNFDTELQTQKGIGLFNLKRRLELVYPKNYDFVEQVNKDIYTAELLLKL